MVELLSRFGARIGNWNDNHLCDKSKAGIRQSTLYRGINRFAGWLYVLPERKATHGR